MLSHEALVLHEKEKPDAAILDAPQADSSPAGTVAAFHRKFLGLRGRTIVLTGEQATRELLKVLDAYWLPQVPLHLLLEGLCPCLDSMLTRNIVPQQVTGNARLVFDSFLQPVSAGIRDVTCGPQSPLRIRRTYGLFFARTGDRFTAYRARRPKTCQF